MDLEMAQMQRGTKEAKVPSCNARDTESVNKQSLLSGRCRRVFHNATVTPMLGKFHFRAIVNNLLRCEQGWVALISRLKSYSPITANMIVKYWNMNISHYQRKALIKTLEIASKYIHFISWNTFIYGSLKKN